MRAIADFCIRHRRLTVLAWIVALFAAGAAAGSAGEKFSTNFQLPDSDSTKALNLLEDRFPKQSGDEIQVVFADDAGLEGVDTTQRIDHLAEELRALDHVVAVEPPSAKQGSISESGTIGFATVELDDAAFELPVSSLEKIVDTANEAGGDGLEVHAGGEPVRIVEQQEEGGSEMIGLLAAIIILLITFGSVVAMAMPVVTAIVALGTALSLITLGTHIIDTADFAPALASMIGLGVGIDYALFVVTRFRQGLADGLEVNEAVVEAMDTAGRAVLFAGITVVIAMLGLFAIGVGFLHAPALAASLAVLLTMTAALTLLPAILSKVGTRIDRLRVRKPQPARAETSRWSRWSRMIQRRPWAAAIASGGLLLVLAIPVFSIDLGSADAGTDPSDSSARQAYDLLAEGFGPGFNGPLQVVVDAPDGASPEATEQELAPLSKSLAATPGVAGVAPAVVNDDGDTAIIQVFPTTSPQDNATSDLVENLRDDVLPPAEQQLGIVAYVGGTTAIYDDFATYISGKLPLFFGIVILLSGLLLMVAFRSVLVPLKAVLMNVLTIGASFGVVVAIFQWGWLGGLIGLDTTAPIESFLPVMVFAIIFGLSMDYEVFLMSRVHEEWERRKDASEAVVHGLASTGRVITAAATIMICVFASFALGGNMTIKLFGVALAAAIAIDAFVIRSLLVPAIMELLGRRAWWLPDWLERILPRLHVEADPDRRRPSPEPATATADD
ncbi:MAG TPA: MMPL family transporter [Solirubrobacterales bacterium]|nr:MMPL family transporter [Solirubrobacterales bacterium]